MDVFVTVSQTLRAVLSEAVPKKDGDRPFPLQKNADIESQLFGRGMFPTPVFENRFFSLSNNAGTSELQTSQTQEFLSSYNIHNTCFLFLP